ncbi:MAG: succinyl-diaminopimelate desuccinylase [marine bacterium B5-7]|nr:MAG: succinyl-diaminopimelate desuccinylase [marine bacterium B5-7]
MITRQRIEDTISLAVELVQQPSVTPADANCQEIISSRLSSLGFSITPLRFQEVTNLWAQRGTGTPLFCFAGHTDVVPTGPEELWEYPPFAAVIADGLLHGRGAADMKGSLAAMVTACESFIARQPDHRGSIAFLLTSDEEGPAVNGTARVIDHLLANDIKIDHCIVGEPTSTATIGDVIKVGRRGSLTAAIRVKGTQGHIAYPELANNPIPGAARLIDVLDGIPWDQGNDNFPPTSFQVSNVHGGTGAGNVIPAYVDILCNFRFSPESDPDSLKEKIHRCCTDLCLDVEIDWTLFGMPFETTPGELLDATESAILQITSKPTERSTTGGTSDGRFIALTGAQILELGPLNATIHRVNESVSVNDLAYLSLIYEKILDRLVA